MSYESVVLAGRGFEERQMTGACVITRNGSEPVLNETTGMYDSPAAGTVYEGICDLRFESSIVREIDAQRQAGVEQEPVLRLPVLESEDVRVGDVAQLTAYPMDPAMVGVRIRIAGIYGGAVTVRRFPVEVTS